MSQSLDFSQGSIPKTITRLAIPMIGAQLVNALYSIVDRIYIGHLPQVGQLALTGIGLCFPITMIISACAALIGNGGGPLCSILRGEHNDDEAENVLGTSLTALVALGLLVMVLCYAIRTPVLYLFGASDSTYPFADRYLSVYLAGTLSVMLTLGLNPFINAQGFTKVGMMTVVIGAIANIILDPIFIFVFDMGVAGAALATILAQTLSAVWIVAFLLGKRNQIRLRREKLVPKPRVLGRVTSLGFSTFIMNITESAISAVFNASLSHFGGDVYVTTMTVATSLSQVLNMPMMGFAQGTQPVTGYNFGAGCYARVRQCFRFLVQFCVTYAVLIWIVLMAVPSVLISIFNSDPDFIATATPMIRIFFCMNFIMALQMAAQNTFVAMGEAKKATFFAIFRKLVLLIPLILILPRLGFGIPGIFAAEPIADTISAVTCFTTFLLTAYRKLKQMERTA
jgi:putative MATE family efflux protein